MTEFVIKDDGTFNRRTVTEVPIDVLPALEQAFQANAKFKFKSVLDFFELGEPFFGKASMSCQSSNPELINWSIRIRTLNLHTAFVLKDGVLTPDFDHHNDKRQQMELPWRMPDDMRLMLGITVQGGENGYSLGKHYLIAYDKKGHMFRLPLSNLYDHMELCHGQDHAIHPTALKAVIVGLQQFKTSLWNADLVHAFQREKAPMMFRFKPVNTGFEQLPALETDWTRLCEKVSNEFVSSNFMPA